MKIEKIQKKYIDHSMGFPVVILNAPLVKVRGIWSLNINYNKYQLAVLILLANKPSKLTGDEQKFIRKYFQMTLQTFAQRFSVKHSAVLKWEKKANKITAMSWNTEKDIRLFIIDQILKKSTELQKLYRVLDKELGVSDKPIQVDSHKIAA